MRSFKTLFALVALAFLVTLPLRGATAIVRTDQGMVLAARSIITGTVVEIYPRYDDNGQIESVIRILVDENVKGEIEAGRMLDVVQFGGSLDGKVEAQSGAPSYRVGSRYLVMLDRDGDGDWTTLDLALGRFEFRFHEGRSLLTRDSREIAGWWESGKTYEDADRLALGFLRYVRGVARGQTPRETYFADGSPLARHSDAVVNLGPQINAIDFDVRTTSEDAVASWSGDPGSTMSDSVSATAATGNTLFLNDCESRIIPDDPGGDITGTFTGSGVVATAFYGCGTCGSCASHTKNGETYVTIDKADIVIQNGVSSTTISQEKFDSTMVHEIGHTWGFRHSNQQKNSSSSCSTPLPCASSAIMNSSIVTGLNGALQPYDEDAANEVYGDGTNGSFTGVQYVTDFNFGPGDLRPTRRQGGMSWRIVETVCSAPVINNEPDSITIAQGASTTLTVGATGTTPFTYQWYNATAGTETNPVGTNSASLNIGVQNVATTLNYWVKVTNACGSDNSATAVVTVQCQAPAITTNPANKSITSGNSTSLSVVATGTGLTYQWYLGSASDTSTPVGTNSSSFNTGSLTTTTSYWVRVSGTCGVPDDSNTATVTVNAGCTAPNISSLKQPQSQQITSGASATLTVDPSGTAPLTYQWYRGNSGSTANPVGTNSDTFNTGALTVDTNFWVKVTNSCGSENSNTAVIDVVSCTLPSISGEPVDATISFSTSATLSVTAADATTITWYLGALGDKSIVVGTGASVSTSVLTATTTFWAALSNSCGEISTRLVTVTVNAVACTAPVITAEPLSQLVARNSSANLTVIATGTAALTYQWYEGVVLDTSKPVGTNDPLFTTPAMTKTTKYWLRVSNSCGSADSAQATVSVPSSRRRSVRK